MMDVKTFEKLIKSYDAIRKFRMMMEEMGNIDLLGGNSVFKDMEEIENVIIENSHPLFQVWPSNDIPCMTYFILNSDFSFEDRALFLSGEGIKEDTYVRERY